MSESLRDLVVSLSLQSDNFSRNIRSVTSQIKEAESAFALAGSGVTGFERTTAGLSSKLSMLQQVIANAARYLSSSAQDSMGASIGGISKSYSTTNSVAVNVDKLSVNDKNDVRALAYEIGAISRRTQLGMGG